MKVKMLPRSGYFAIGPSGIPREGFELPYKHRVPTAPKRLTPDSIVKPITRNESAPFKRFLVEALADVKESGSMGWLTDAPEWLEGGGYVEAVEAVCNQPGFVDIRYRITPKGERFLKEYEAPVEW